MSSTEKNNGHTWYHDGFLSSVGTGSGVTLMNRLCTRCRFREQVIKDVPCFGSPEIYVAALDQGFREGVINERERMRKVLGL